MLIGLCGFKRAGKDTVASGLVQVHGFTRVAFADALRREVAEIDGIPVAEDAMKDVPAANGRTYRDALIDRGQARRAEDPDYWVKQLQAIVLDMRSNANVVVSDCRFPNEFAWVREHGGHLVWIRRCGVVSNGDITEQDWSHKCDFTFDNDMSTPPALAARLLQDIELWTGAPAAA
ncbi:MAG TPA: hypothetical protein VFQ88_07215 [Nevskiaceae bacterium]|nr:hypothetical protein [Nevskiaceae bacterium]